MMHLLHQCEIVWRQRQAEQERELEERRRVLERAAAEPRPSILRTAVARFVRRPA